MDSKHLGLADVKAKRDRVEAPSHHAWGLASQGCSSGYIQMARPYRNAHQSPAVLVWRKPETVNLR